MKRPVPVESAAALIDEKIKELGDWRGKTLAKVREIIHEADPEIVEEWKWMGSPVWSHDGIIAVANAHKDKVKLTFSHGASLPDPDKLFNAGLEGNAWRAIDFFEGDKINERALKNLVRAAVDYNQIKLKRKAPRTRKLNSYAFYHGGRADPGPRCRRRGLLEGNTARGATGTRVRGSYFPGQDPRRLGKHEQNPAESPDISVTRTEL